MVGLLGLFRPFLTKLRVLEWFECNETWQASRLIIYLFIDFCLTSIQQLALRSLSPGRKIVVSFTAKYDVLFLVNSNTEFSSYASEKGKATLVLSSVFVSCEEKDCYSVVLEGLRARTAGTVTMVLSKSGIFSQFFSSFESEGITKHLMTGPSENSSTFRFFLDPQCSIEVSGRQKSLFPFTWSLRHVIQQIPSWIHNVGFPGFSKGSEKHTKRIHCICQIMVTMQTPIFPTYHFKFVYSINFR